MTIEVYDRLRETGNTWLIILVTSGIGGLLNAIANLKWFECQRIELGIAVTVAVSIVLILTGIIIRQHFYCKAEKVRERWRGGCSTISS